MCLIKIGDLTKKIIKKAKDRKNTDDMILSTQELS